MERKLISIATFAPFEGLTDYLYLMCAFLCLVSASLAAGMTIGLLSLDPLKLKVKAIIIFNFLSLSHPPTHTHTHTHSPTHTHLLTRFLKD